MDTLKHHGIKGMRWGVRRNSNRPGGADGKEESTKVKDTRGTLRKKMDSMKRERQWKTVVREMDKLSTKDINSVKKRIDLENDLKILSKSKVGKQKDKNDYLRREFMSDAELNRKVVRLRAKKGLEESVSKATKEQREFGIKVAQIGGSLGVKYAVNKRLTPKDLFDTVSNPKGAAGSAKNDLQKMVMNKINAKSSRATKV